MTLPTGWGTAALSEVAGITMGQSPPGSSYNISGDGLPFFQGKAEFGPMTATVRKWTTAGTKFAHAGDILLSVRAPVGPTNFTPTNCALGRGLAGLRSGPDLEQRFLFWNLRALQQGIAALGKGSTFEAITGKQLRDVRVVVPPRDEQRHIVDLLEDHLSRIDAAVSSLDAAGRWLLALRRSQLETTKRLASASGRVLSLSQVSIDARYGTSAKCVIDGAGVAVVRIPNLVNGSVDLADEKRVEDPIGDMAGLMLEQGDVLVVRTNGSRDLIGRAAVVQEGVNAAFASYLIRYRVDESQVRPLWVRMMFDAPSTREALESMAASSAGQFNLGLKKLDTVRLPVPLLTVQDDLLASADTTFAALSRLGRQVQDARERAAGLRAALLAAAFSGALSIAPATMELAHV